VAQVPGDAVGSDTARMNTGDISFAQVGYVDLDDDDGPTISE
jgi:hypothetical protein